MPTEADSRVGLFQEFSLLRMEVWGLGTLWLEYDRRRSSVWETEATPWSAALRSNSPLVKQIPPLTDGVTD